MAVIVIAAYYPFPFCYRYLPKTALDFWDVVYYLAARRGAAFTTTMKEVCALMTGNASHVDPRKHEAARRAFMAHWKRAVHQGAMAEETELDELAFDSQGTDESGDRYTYRGAGRSYHFRLLDYPSSGSYLLKPCGYVERGWIADVQPAFPKRMLNFALSLPKGGGAGPLGGGHSASFLIREFRREVWEEAAILANYRAASTALQWLVGLGLLVKRNGLYLLEEAAFGWDSPTWSRSAAPPAASQSSQ